MFARIGGRTALDAYSGSGVVSYLLKGLGYAVTSNAVPDAATVDTLLREFKPKVEIRPVEHTYSFGTHAAATRRNASEYLFIGRS